MKYADIDWVDNQPYSSQYHDVYYSACDGLSESEYVFLLQNNLAQRFKRSKGFIVAEAGFGTGLNFIATCRLWLKHSPENSVLSYVGIEKYPVSPDDIRRVSEQWDELSFLFEELLGKYPPAVSGTHIISLFDGRVQLNLEFLDIDEALTGCRFKADAWFLDGFNPKHNIDMWSESFIRKILAHSKSGTSLSTYTAAGHVRRRLENSGFEVLKVKGHANKREMITAHLKHEPHYRPVFPWYMVPHQSYVDKTAIVIGAGLAGLTTSLAMINKGWHVTLIDRHEKIAQEASGNPAAVLLPRMALGNDTERHYFVNAFLYAVRKLDELQKQSSINFWHKTGVCSKELVDKAEKILALYQFNEEFVREENSLIEGNILINDRGKEKHKVLNFPSAGWVAMDKLCGEIFRLIEKDINYKNATVKEINKVGDHWHVSDENKALASASVVVLATGKSISDNEMTSWLPVTTVRGQMTTLEATKKSLSLSRVSSFGRFVTPAHNGIHYTGASYDIDDLSSDLSDISQKENIKNLNSHFPGMFSGPDHLSGRVGFRSVSEDRMPVVGLVPDKTWFVNHYSDLCHGRVTKQYEAGQYHRGLYVNGAHGSRGLTTSFLSAEILVSIMEGTPKPVTARLQDALNPSRFIIRRLKRSRGRQSR